MSTHFDFKICLDLVSQICTNHPTAYLSPVKMELVLTLLTGHLAHFEHKFTVTSCLYY